MQLTRDSVPANLIRAWEPGRIRIAERWITGHLLVMPERIVEGWNVVSPTGLVLHDLREALAVEPEIVLLGTGLDLLWPDADLAGELAASGVGLEIMSTPAASRTFNVLVQEQRRVVAALFNFEK
ncbi:MAG TPA: MTH938/NDUFAF3 family protein [Gammaproteobacteria bacterium]|nr:MTH938/NDUFAF3 family protein [Gammaproteobacteria bacterium]